MVEDYTPEEDMMGSLLAKTDVEKLALVAGDIVIVLDKPLLNPAKPEEGLSEFWLGYKEHESPEDKGLFPKANVVVLEDEEIAPKPKVTKPKMKIQNPMFQSDGNAEDDDADDDDDDDDSAVIVDDDTESSDGNITSEEEEEEYI